MAHLFDINDCNAALFARWGAGLCAATLWFVPVLTSPAAEEGALSGGSNRSTITENAENKQKSIETLTEITRRSVVVVSHYGRDGSEEGVGAGFVVSTNGLIATSLHVIGEARPITVRLAEGKRYDATEVYAWDRKLDLAIVRIEAPHLPALPLGDSDLLKQGASVLAMGNPLGLEHSVVQGIVSGRRNFGISEMIQLAMPVEPGNSGGPLIDMQGRVQGILTLKSALTANLGFAMPINELKPLLAKPNPVPMQRWVNMGRLNSDEWTALFGGRWSQKPGRIQAEGFGSGFGGRSLCLFNKPIPEPPFEVAVTVRLDDEAGAAGLVFAADGDQKHYGFYPSAGRLRLTRFNGPNLLSWTILEQVESADYRPGEWNTLKVQIEEARIRCYVNDSLVIESTNKGVRNGKVGMAKFRETRAMFKDFRVGSQLTPANQLPSKEMEAAILQQVHDFSTRPAADLISALQSEVELSQVILSERARKLEQEAGALRKLAAAVHRQSVESELLKIFQAPEEQIDLFYAAMLIAKLDNPEVEIEPYRHQLAEMGREIALAFPREASDETKLMVLNNYLFKENGFHGSRSDYYNRANSYMNQVLDDREGLPITLSVLFLELAHRVGLTNVVGVPLPGHFVVKSIARSGKEQLIDVYDGGKLLSREEANDLVVSYTGAPLVEEQLRAATKREVVVRMLRNLLEISQNSEPASDPLHYLDLMAGLDPDAAEIRLKRARIRLQTGDRSGAKQDFKWLIDHQPDNVNLEQIAEIYRSL